MTFDNKLYISQYAQKTLIKKALQYGKETS